MDAIEKLLGEVDDTAAIIDDYYERVPECPPETGDVLRRLIAVCRELKRGLQDQWLAGHRHSRYILDRATRIAEGKEGRE